jgi:stearoyl-CoA desaturase (delta-9 desaturase)
MWLLAVVVACASGWLSILCLSLFAHRSIAHRAVVFHPVVAHPARFWLWLTTGAATRRWVAVHRKHHIHTDEIGDPHSPKVYGLAKIFFAGYWYYRREATDPDVVAAHGANCPDDWLERNVYERHDNLGLVLLALIDLVVFGWPGLLAFGIQLIWLALWASGVINGLGHALGYRNFDTQDASRNIVPVAVLVSGEELHNNHHRWPRSAKFSTRWWEIDIGWWVIRVLAFFGLASEIYVRNKRWPHTPAEALVSVTPPAG